MMAAVDCYELYTERVSTDVQYSFRRSSVYTHARDSTCYTIGLGDLAKLLKINAHYIAAGYPERSFSMFLMTHKRNIILFSNFRIVINSGRCSTRTCGCD